MSVFFGYIYILKGEDDYSHVYTFPNFKEAYEYLEHIAKENPIIDLGLNTDDSAKFDVVFAYKHSLFKSICVKRYAIHRTLLHIPTENDIVSYDFVQALIKHDEHRGCKQMYSLVDDYLH